MNKKFKLQQRERYLQEFFRGPMMNFERRKIWKSTLTNRLQTSKKDWMVDDWNLQLRILNEVMNELDFDVKYLQLSKHTKPTPTVSELQLNASRWCLTCAADTMQLTEPADKNNPSGGDAWLCKQCNQYTGWL